MSSFLNFLKSKNLYLGLCRYILGLMMMPYAISKILRLQFIVLPEHTWQLPLEKLSGSSLAWSFLGYSSWFQVLLGCLELIPALLLLFRRTTLLGALLMLPMTLNVFLINQAYDLWHSTKVISTVLLVLNVATILFEWKDVKQLLGIILNRRKKFAGFRWEVVVNAVVILAVGIWASGTLIDYMHQTNELTGDWYNRHPNAWTLRSEKMRDSLTTTANQTVYFGAYGSFEEVSESGKASYGQYKLNRAKHVLQLESASGKNETMSYHLQGDSLLVLEPVDHLQSGAVTKIFAKRIINSGR